MLLNKVDLEIELLSERKKFKSENEILSEVKAILFNNDRERKEIAKHLKEKSSTKSNEFIFDLLETNKIFHLDQIKKVCIDYRLRFLESHYFKNEIPDEAVTNIRLLEKNHATKLEGFMIAATSKSFHLLNYDDPLLFAQMGNGYYYLIHKWGDEMNTVRKWLLKPIKNLWNFTICCVTVSILIAYLVPTNNLSKSVRMAPIIIFLFAFKSLIAIFLYYFFMMGKNFNTEIWNRKYYNN
jgi:hypothetical protein